MGQAEKKNSTNSWQIGQLTSTPAWTHSWFPNSTIWVSASVARRVFRNCPIEVSLLGLTFASETETARRAAKIFKAAFTSRSWLTPHWGQSHSRMLRSNLRTMCPQSKHRLELGNHRSVLIKVRPYQSHLYSSCLTNSDQLASLIEIACNA